MSIQSPDPTNQEKEDGEIEDPGILFIYNDATTIHACMSLPSFGTVTTVPGVAPLVQGKNI